MMNLKHKQSIFTLGRKEGPHILLLSVVSIPIVFLCAICATGYLGVLTWYNIFLHFFDDRTLCHRLAICPLLILSFPPILLVVTLGLSVYASIDQLSWRLEHWSNCIRDLEKGFFAKVCAQLRLPECCPYEVVILREEEDSLELATEDLSLKGIVITKSDSPSVES